MSRFHKPVMPTLVITTLSILAASCGESKVSQCNRLIEVANQAASDIQTITATDNATDTNARKMALTRVADTVDQAKTSIDALDFSDERLVDFRQQFSTMYTDISQSTRTMVQALDASNSQDFQAAYERLQQATDRETPLVTEVNTYCSGTAQPVPDEPETTQPDASQPNTDGTEPQ